MKEPNLAGIRLEPKPADLSGYEVTTADGIWIKQYVFRDAGSVIPQHAHVWDHTTMLATGAIYVWKDGRPDRRYDAPCAIFIEAGVKHKFLTLAPDTTIFCIHNALHPEVAAVLAKHELEFE